MTPHATQPDHYDKRIPQLLQLLQKQPVPRRLLQDQLLIIIPFPRHRRDLRRPLVLFGRNTAPLRCPVFLELFGVM